MRKILASLLCLFIPSKGLRRHLRAWLTEFDPVADQKNLAEFLSAQVPEKCVLLVEPSITHGELAPGFAKYWLDLGYHVHALLHRRVAEDNPFCRFNHERLRIFRHAYCCYEKFLAAPRIKEYDFIFFTTPAYARWTENGRKRALRDVSGFISRSGNNVFLVEHHLGNIEPYGETALLHNNRLVTLAEFQWEDRPTLMINPHYFGRIRVTPKKDRINFIVIGAVDLKRKNHGLLLTAAARLFQQGLRNFHVTIIGVGRARQAELLRSIPARLKGHFSFRGWLKFDELYDRMEEADYFLPLLDPAAKSHERYLTTGVSGSYQLVLGFRKPCLIHEKFAPFHKFTEENSILYADDLAKAMERAMALSPSEYACMQQGLEKLSAGIYEKSFRNLEDIVSGPAHKEGAW